MIFESISFFVLFPYFILTTSILTKRETLMMLRNFERKKNLYYDEGKNYVVSMSKNRDLIQILLIITLGMFIPFLGSIIISFKLNPLYIEDLLKIVGTFGWFLLIFGIEFSIVYLYFWLTNIIAEKKLNQDETMEK